MSLLFLNELSCDTSIDKREASRAMNDLAMALLPVHQACPDAALVCVSTFPHWQIGQGYSAVQWMNESGQNRERARVLLLLQQRAPFHLPPEGVDAESEYSHQGRVGVAFQSTDLHDGMTISLPVCADWEEPWLSVVRTRPEEDEDGEVNLCSTEVELRHCARTAHVFEHGEWLRRDGLDSLTTGSAIWEARKRYFPQLSFLPVVERNLCELKPAWVIPVRNRLVELQEAVAAWNPVLARTPDYRSKVSGESESRRQQGLADFTDLDGQSRLFELHARFTPGAGRLHFRLIPEERQARVAYIGMKLGI